MKKLPQPTRSMHDAVPKPESPSIPELIIRAPKEEEEFQYLWARLCQMKEQGSPSPNFRVPEHPLVEEIIDSPEKMNAEMKDRLRAAHKEELYDPSVYQATLEQLESVHDSVKAAFAVFQKLHDDWGFMTFAQYTVRLSRYVYGGSYGYEEDGSNAVAVISARRTGETKRSSHAESPIHEFVHCGIALPIVHTFHLNQEEKERVVDLLIVHSLGDVLPGYRVDSEPSRVDDFVTASAISDLPRAISEYVKAVLREE